MKTEEEIKDFLKKCNNASGFGMSKGPCPAEKKRRKGCCAECSMPSTLKWVLGDDIKASNNGQERMFENLKENK